MSSSPAAAWAARTGGRGHLNHTDVEDHAKVIQWAAAQPWCDGQVVLFGTSYYGLTQPQVARLRPPALKGFFTNEMCTDFFRHIAMFGGAPQPDFFSLWMGRTSRPCSSDCKRRRSCARW